MNRTLAGSARLFGAEPNIDLSFEMTKLGNILAILQITPDIVNQQHQINFECDQSYLSALIDDLRVLIDKYSQE
jgi:hypothetical protein